MVQLAELLDAQEPLPFLLLSARSLLWISVTVRRLIFGVDEEIDRTAVFVGRALLAVSGDILIEKALPKSLHGCSRAAGVALRSWVAAGLGLGVAGPSRAGSPLRREDRDGSEGHAAEPAVGAELHDEELRPEARTRRPKPGSSQSQ